MVPANWKPQLDSTFRMQPSDSVSQWIVQLKNGESDAAQHIWERYFGRLVGLAKGQLKGQASPLFDEEDVALSVLDTVWRGAQCGNFPRLNDRTDLWSLLIAITKQKVVDRRRWQLRQKRGGDFSQVQFSACSEDGAEASFSLEALLADTETPEFLVSLQDEFLNLMDELRDDSLRQVAEGKLKGENTQEIAKRIGVSPRTIQRKLKLVQEQWVAALLEIR